MPSRNVQRRNKCEQRGAVPAMPSEPLLCASDDEGSMSRAHDLGPWLEEQAWMHMRPGIHMLVPHLVAGRDHGARQPGYVPGEAGPVYSGPGACVWGGPEARPDSAGFGRVKEILKAAGWCWPNTSLQTCDERYSDHPADDAAPCPPGPVPAAGSRPPAHRASGPEPARCGGASGVPEQSAQRAERQQLSATE